MKASGPTSSCVPNRQRGIALITSLILLVVMTLLGLAVIRSITQEERMAGQNYSRSLAFQATESALRTVEELIETKKPTPAAGAACAALNGLMSCGAPLATDIPRWNDTAFASWEALPAVGSGTLAVTPQYFVEYLGNTFACRPGNATDPNDCKRYRITARSSDGTGGKTMVMLQSVYATD
jgi:type IV pilus assembly protein PilX